MIKTALKVTSGKNQEVSLAEEKIKLASVSARSNLLSKTSFEAILTEKSLTNSDPAITNGAISKTQAKIQKPDV